MEFPRTSGHQSLSAETGDSAEYEESYDVVRTGSSGASSVGVVSELLPHPSSSLQDVVSVRFIGYRGVVDYERFLCLHFGGVQSFQYILGSPVRMAAYFFAPFRSMGDFWVVYSYCRSLVQLLGRRGEKSFSYNR